MKEEQLISDEINQDEPGNHDSHEDNEQILEDVEQTEDQYYPKYEKKGFKQGSEDNLHNLGHNAYTQDRPYLESVQKNFIQDKKRNSKAGKGTRIGSKTKNSQSEETLEKYCNEADGVHPDQIKPFDLNNAPSNGKP